MVTNRKKKVIACCNKQYYIKKALIFKIIFCFLRYKINTMKHTSLKSIFLIAYLLLLCVPHTSGKTPNPCDTYSTTSTTSCDSYTWSCNGTTYTVSGSYTCTSLNNAGCVHTETLDLIINNSTSSNFSLTQCNSYTFNGTTYTTSGTYSFASVNASGCTHTDYLNLTIRDLTNLTIIVSPQDPNNPCSPLKHFDYSPHDPCFIVERTCWPVTNPYELLPMDKDISNDSVLNVFQITDICNPGCVYTVSFGLDHASDSVVYTTKVVCGSYTDPRTGITHNSSGTFTTTSTSTSGCSIIYILELTVNNGTNNTSNIISCNSYTWAVNGTTYTASGTYTFTFVNPSGCVNTETLNLIISCSVPTLSEWGLLLLLLLCISFGMSFIYSRESSLSLINGKGTDSRMSLLDKGLFTRIFFVVMGIEFITCTLVYKLYGNISTTDMIGSLMTSLIVTYIIQLYLLMKRFEKNQ